MGSATVIARRRTKLTNTIILSFCAVFVEAGDALAGAVYAELTKTVVGTYISLELYRREISTMAKHGKNKVKHVLLKKLRLGDPAWRNGYIKPGHHRFPFCINTSKNMLPTIEGNELSETFDLKQEPTSGTSGRKNKTIRYVLKLRFPGDSAQRAKSVIEHDVHISASEHPTLPSLA